MIYFYFIFYFYFLIFNHTGHSIGPPVLFKVLEMLVRLASQERNPLELYTQAFEQPLLAATQQFYAREAAAILHSDGVLAFLTKAQTFLVRVWALFLLLLKLFLLPP